MIFGNIPIHIQILYKILNKKGNREARLAHLISGLCPESISEHPGLDFSSWPSAAGIIRFFSEHFSKKSTSHSPSGISSRSKKLLQVILYLSTFSKKVRTRNLIFRFQDIKQVSGKNNKKNLFSILSLLGVILQRLCSRQVPHVASHPRSLYPGISDLGGTCWLGWLGSNLPGEPSGGSWGNPPERLACTASLRN